MRHAPSRIEYSEWTWRWTKSAWAIAGGSVYAGVLTPQPRAPEVPGVRRKQGRIRFAPCAGPLKVCPSMTDIWAVRRPPLTLCAILVGLALITAAVVSQRAEATAKTPSVVRVV